MERFVIIVNGFQPLTIITKRSILDVAAVLEPPLHITDLPEDTSEFHIYFSADKNNHIVSRIFTFFHVFS